jgi:hypothetical protein
MSLGRLLVVALLLVLGWWLLTRAGILSSRTGPEPSTAPVDRARTAAAASSGRAAETGAAQREADAAVPSAGVSENMTPEQVQALLGPPDETIRETTETGAPRLKWVYRRVGKTVVFEDGIVARVE